jgi:hypothetical protein
MLHPISNKNLRYIIVGTGRCGTVYFAKILNSVGIPCSHERIFTTKGMRYALDILNKGGGKDSDVSQWANLEVKCTPQAEASYMAVPYLNHSCFQSTTVIHIVRNPLKVIQSFSNKLQYWRDDVLNEYERFIQKNLPTIEQYNGSLLRCTHYIVDWNKRIEACAQFKKYIRVKLETDTDLLLDFLKIPTTSRNNIPKKPVNTHEEWKRRTELNPRDCITDEDILKSPLGNEIIELSKKYGYKLNSE